MRKTISGLVAAFAVMTAGAAPAMACGGGLFGGSCWPCGQAYVEPCAPQVYAPPAPVYYYSGCNTGCGWGFDRLADPVQQYHASPVQHQYYYVNQGPTYTGPGAFAPYPTYQDGPVYRAHPHYWHHGYRYLGHTGFRYGYRPHHGMHYGYRAHVHRRYY